MKGENKTSVEYRKSSSVEEPEANQELKMGKDSSLKQFKTL